MINSRNNPYKRKRRVKRKIQCAIRCTILFLILLAIIVFIAFAVKSCIFDNKKSGKSKGNTATEGEVNSGSKSPENIPENSTTDNNSNAGNNNVQAVDSNVKKMEYPKKSDGYMDITSEEILSPYVAVINVTDNKLVAGKNAETRIYPASMTKVMTLIVAVENIDNMDNTFTMTSAIIDPLYKDSATRAGFEPGEAVTAKDLMYGLILPSGADGAVGLAEMISGSEEEFVKLMNKKCEEMGLTNTHFTNTSGLHNEDHYTTPVEMAMILQYAMENETCAEILSTYQYTTQATEKHPEGILLTSTMFSRMYGNEVGGVEIKAGKTGYTQEAKHCLVSYAESYGKKYIAVTAGAEGKWNVIYDDFKLYGEFCEGATGTEEQNQNSIQMENG